MKSGTRVVGFNTPMPANTQRRHESTKSGDSKSAIIRTQHAAAGADHVKCLDYNMQILLLRVGGTKRYVPVSGHWTVIGKNGYDRWVDAQGHVRKLSRATRRQTVQSWVNSHGGDAAALHMLRRRNGDYPMTWEESIAFAEPRGVVLTPELKSVLFATPELCSEMVAAARRIDYPVWSMALINMKNCRGKCEAMVGAGGQFAIIFGRFRRLARRPPADWARWSHHPTQIWGPASAKAWLHHL